jgi:hypothetical protein
MLLGLAAVALPVLAHLLSRRRYDVVQWGAMQFLDVGRKTRRRIRLEQVLLLMLRMGMIAILALGFARPWLSGGFLANHTSKQNRDVVIVIDGSSSMGWQGKAQTPHSTAVQWAEQFLDTLRAGDSIALLESRDVVRPVVEPLTTDQKRIRTALEELPPPRGSSDLAEAAADALRLLAGGSHLARDVVILTDGQARGWAADDTIRWELFDDLRQQISSPPRVWVVEVGDHGPNETNFSVDRLQLSREMVAPRFPVRVRTKIHRSGGEGSLSRKVYLEIDGQRLADSTVQTPPLAAGSEFSVEFEHRFPSPGSHVLSVVLDEDDLPADNRADAAVEVAAALPVLLVDGDPQLDPTRTETFFARAALSASEIDTPLVQASTIRAEELTAERIRNMRVIVLANVRRLTPLQLSLLETHVADGGGLLVAAGDKVDANFYNESLYRVGRGLLPAQLVEIKSEPADNPLAIHVDSLSLELPEYAALRTDKGGTLALARFSKWWRVAPALKPAVFAGPAGVDEIEGLELSAALVEAKLSTGDPFLVSRTCGRGRVLLMSAPLDSDWSTLPAKQDYVPFLHELMFSLARGSTARRNVQIGEPLLTPTSPDFDWKRMRFYTPDGKEERVDRAGDDAHPLARLNDTAIPGIYTLAPQGLAPGQRRTEGEQFVVDYDRGESDLAPLDAAQQAALISKGRMQFVKTLDELERDMYADDARAEFWYLMLLLILGLLTFELVMTRWLVRGSHAGGVIDEA